MAGMRMPRGRGAVPPVGVMKKGVLKRLLKMLFKGLRYSNFYNLSS